MEYATSARRMSISYPTSLCCFITSFIQNKIQTASYFVPDHRLSTYWLQRQSKPKVLDRPKINSIKEFPLLTHEPQRPTIRASLVVKATRTQPPFSSPPLVKSLPKESSNHFSPCLDLVPAAPFPTQPALIKPVAKQVHIDELLSTLSKKEQFLFLRAFPIKVLQPGPSKPCTLPLRTLLR